MYILYTGSKMKVGTLAVTAQFRALTVRQVDNYGEEYHIYRPERLVRSLHQLPPHNSGFLSATAARRCYSGWRYRKVNTRHALLLREAAYSHLLAERQCLVVEQQPEK